jgi:hypothetical protein
MGKWWNMNENDDHPDWGSKSFSTALGLFGPYWIPQNSKLFEALHSMIGSIPFHSLDKTLIWNLSVLALLNQPKIWIYVWKNL